MQLSTEFTDTQGEITVLTRSVLAQDKKLTLVLMHVLAP